MLPLPYMLDVDVDVDVAMLHVAMMVVDGHWR